jgi:hypothetical protein
MVIRFTRTFIFFSSFLLIAACKDKTSDKETIIDIQKEFSIQIWEKLDSPSSRLQLRLETVKKQECGGTRINTYVNQLGDKVTMTFRSLAYPPTCSGFTEAALDTVDFPKLDKGAYSFQVNLKDFIINEGQLRLTDERIEIDMKTENGISFNSKSLNRVPKNALWGIIAFDNGQETKVENFKNTIGDPLSISSIDYGHFNMTTGEVEIPAKWSSAKPKLSRFLKKQILSNTEFDKLLNRFRSDPSLDFILWNAEGKVFTK